MIFSIILYPLFSVIVSHNGMPVWKKKEITKTERTVEYTTIDVEGNLQELYEFEVTETEVNW
jgi:hypothetical protein